MRKRMVFVGCGPIHMTALLGMRDYVDAGNRVTLVSRDPCRYHHRMGSALLSGSLRPEAARIDAQALIMDRGGFFVTDEVEGLNPEERTLVLRSAGEVAYDLISFDTGDRPRENMTGGAGAENVFAVTPVANLVEARSFIHERARERRLKIVVVGGSAEGVEVAGAAWRLVSDRGGESDITLISATRILRSLPEKARDLALASFERRGIVVREERTVMELRDGTAACGTGERVAYDVAFLAGGLKPAPLFATLGLPTGEDGALLVNDFMQSVAHPDVFGVGRCATPSPAAAAGAGESADRQARRLRHNLWAALEDGEMMGREPGAARRLILDMGDGRAIFVGNRRVWQGRPAYWIKAVMDRVTLRRFR